MNYRNIFQFISSSIQLISHVTADMFTLNALTIQINLPNTLSIRKNSLFIIKSLVDQVLKNH